MSLSQSTPQQLYADQQLTIGRCAAAQSTAVFRVRVSPSVVHRPAHAPSLSFTSGFLLGQLSVVILFGAFIKFFIFGEAPPADASGSRRAPPLGATSPAHRRSASVTYAASPSPARRQPHDAHATAAAPPILRPAPPPAALIPPAHILAKTYYDVHAHPPESLDWFNVLVAQALAQLRADAATDGALLASLTQLLNGPRRPDFLERVAVTEIGLGEDFPIFSHCRVRPVAAAAEDGDEHGGKGRLQAHMDVDLSDCLSLGIETTMVLNYPRPRTAVLPVALRVEVARFSGTLSISFLPASTAAPAPSSTSAQPSTPPAGGRRADAPDAGTSAGSASAGRTPTTLAFAFEPDYTLALSTRSLLGARSRLQDVPKIAQLVESRLRAWFEERCVAPRRQQIVVPSLWPRMRNTVAGEGSPGDGGGEGVGTSPRRRPRESGGEGSREWPAAGTGEVGREWEGLRLRTRGAEGRGGSGGEGFEMPGSMPGMLVT